jgi:hypothetical protein
MTTIAGDARCGTMVADSKMVMDPMWFPTTKILKRGDELIATAGDARAGELWLHWYLSGKLAKCPKLPDDFEALVLRHNGLYHCGEGGLETRIERGFIGIGSGGAAATAVMLAGHDVKFAVRIACMVDTNSGGRLQVCRLGGR